MSGGITSGSFDIVAISVVIGWIALIVTLICAVVALVVMAIMHSEGGVDRVVRLLENVPFTKKAMHQLALSRFTSVVSVFIASGLTTDQAMKDALTTIEHRGLFAQVEQAYNAILNRQRALLKLLVILRFLSRYMHACLRLERVLAVLMKY